ncbi:hypothetical protein WJX81_004850 [Elliptochloris bilobata]|uniref:diaminopimelate epimerase n=1 Tax=Elliptochloris bilobata TaxID=381761 RepID=A0AAW1S404_9CHLO
MGYGKSEDDLPARRKRAVQGLLDRNASIIQALAVLGELRGSCGPSSAEHALFVEARDNLPVMSVFAGAEEQQLEGGACNASISSEAACRGEAGDKSMPESGGQALGKPQAIGEPDNGGCQQGVLETSDTFPRVASLASWGGSGLQRACSSMASLHSLPSLRSWAAEFCKYQGLGNDFILVDNRHQKEPVISPEQAARVCDRNFGVGGDGVIFALPAETGSVDYAMRIFNSDGSEPEMCGNGIRCLARFVADRDGSGPSQHRVGTLAGLIQPSILEDGQVCVDMGEPILEGPRVPTTLPPTQGHAVVRAPLEVQGREWLMTCVSMGNPHAITFGTQSGGFQVADLDLPDIGPVFERHQVFPARTNTEFVEVLDRGHVRMAVWERGAGQTLACGTGACATVVAGVLEGRTERKCRVDLPGGPLHIEWRAADNHVFMTGPAELVFSGTLQL